MSKLQLGYVGCGFMAQNVHLPNFTRTELCDVQGLVEVRPDLGTKVQARFGIPHLYTDHRDMARTDAYDAFAVSAGFVTQGQIARDLLRTGRPVFMEKPMAVTVRQAAEIVEAAQTPGARLMVGYMRRYDAGNQLVKARLKEFQSTGRLGELFYMRSHGFCGDWIGGLNTENMETSAIPIPREAIEKPAWLPDSHLRTYIDYLQQYVHNLNLLRFLLDAGDDAQVKAVDLDAHGPAGVVSMTIRGVRAILESGRISHHRWDEHTQLYFQHGWIHTWAPHVLHENLPTEVEIYYGGKEHTYERPLPAARWSWAYRREIESFLQNIRTGAEFLSPGEDAYTDIRLMEDIFRRHLA